MGKIYREATVFEAAQRRVEFVFKHFERVVISFSGGKDSSVMFHLVADEARRVGKKFGVLIVDLEAQYKLTIDHIKEMLAEYSDCAEPFWVCLPLSLRNAASNFDPRWCCWDEDRRDIWVREYPKTCIKDLGFFPWFRKGMEFEEFVPLFAEWYGQGRLTATFVGIRADESLNRYRTVASHAWLKNKEMFNDLPWTTLIVGRCYNIYPIYDWKTQDIWVYHRKNPGKHHNKIYDLMHQAGVKPSQQRLCQPYGDDQRRGLWLFHILEPKTWSKVVARVSGANGMSLYVEETGNITGYNKVRKPEGHTWKSFVHLLLTTMPAKTRNHYLARFRSFIRGWRQRGYETDIPDEAPYVLEHAHWAPSYRRLAKTLLRNDYWCKTLGLTQPKSDAWSKFKAMKSGQKPEPVLHDVWGEFSDALSNN